MVAGLRLKLMGLEIFVSSCTCVILGFTLRNVCDDTSGTSMSIAETIGPLPSLAPV